MGLYPGCTSSVYGSFKYGAGVLYGAATTICQTGPEDSGPSTGGNSFVIRGNGFDPRQWDDDFLDTSLNASKWSDISVGGSVTTGVDHLLFFTGTTAGSTAGVQSVASWQNVQGEVRAVLFNSNVYPNSEVVVCRFNLFCDASNFATMYVTMNSVGAFLLCCETWVGGLLADSLIKPIEWSTGSCILKILRWGDRVYFIGNGSVLWSTVQAPTGLGYFQFLCENRTQAYEAGLLRVEYFYYRPFAVFQNQPVHDTVVVSDRRLRGTVPPSKDSRWVDAAYAGLVDISVVGNGLVTKESAYEYYYVKGLKMINESQFGVVLEVIGDAQLETPEGFTKGLGDGY